MRGILACGGALAGIAVAVLAGCRSSPATREPQGFAPVSLFPLPDHQRGWAEDLEPSENRFALNLTGIHGVDAERAFVFGNIRVGGHVMRSVMLRTANGGLTWDEVLPPYDQSEVVEVDFVGCTGFALVGWVEEGPGDLTLLGTQDCGERWELLSELPKSHWSGWPLAMEFQDPFNGAVTLEYTDDEAGRGVLRTQDGGRTWTEVKVKAPKGEEKKGLERSSRTRDGFEWRLDEARTQDVVKKRAGPKAPWTDAAVLPVRLRYTKGMLAPAQGEP